LMLYNKDIRILDIALKNETFCEINRDETEKILLIKPNGSYLIRPSFSNILDINISYKSNEQIYHILITDLSKYIEMSNLMIATNNYFYNPIIIKN
jgi:hypothetical protein